MYHIFFIHSSTDGHSHGFNVLAMINSAVMNIFELWFSLNICPGMGLQDYITALFLLFKGTSILSSIVAVPIYILTNSE